MSITEDQIAAYLSATPDFFERHTELLASLRVPSPHQGRTISLSERQVELLRERLLQNTNNFNRLLGLGHENSALAGRLHQWMLHLLVYQTEPDVDAHVAQSLQDIFALEQVKVVTTPAAKALALTLSRPRCGNARDAFFVDTQMLPTLPAPGSVSSMAVVPLPDVGVLVFASADAQRYTAQMDTEFLTRLGELAHAALLGRV